MSDKYLNASEKHALIDVLEAVGVSHRRLFMLQSQARIERSFLHEIREGIVGALSQNSKLNQRKR